MLLSNCASKPSGLPKEAYEVKPWPYSPEGNYGWKETGDYILKGHDAWGDCTAKLEAIKPQ